MISHGVEISIAGGGADEKDELIAWTGPLLLPHIVNGDPSGVWVGRSLSGHMGRECREGQPVPGR